MGIREKQEVNFMIRIGAPNDGNILSGVTAHKETLWGGITCSWSTDKSSVNMTVVIPTNSHGTIWFPYLQLPKVHISIDNHTIWNNGKYIPGVSGIVGAKVVPVQPDYPHDCVVLDVGSGAYNFVVEGS